MVNHLKKQEQQRLDKFCQIIESHLSNRSTKNKPSLESSDYEMIDMRGHSRRTDSLFDRQRYEGALKELYSFTFTVNYYGEEDTYPVGKFGVAHPKFPEVPLVLDWRSDTAMLAAGFNGEAIQVPEGHIVGKTDLDVDRPSRRVRSARSQKARFPHRASIFKQEKSETKHMKVQTVDDKEWLGRELSKTQQHRSIDGFISTRQAEQNRIIQMPISTYMIVQGAAGSGKTLAALHRMSYLQYHDPRRKMLYLGPNEATLQQMLKDAEHLQIQTVSTYSFKEWTRRFKVKEVSPQQIAQLMPLYRGDDLLEWTEEAIFEWRAEMEEKLREHRAPEEVEHLHEKALAIWFGSETLEGSRRDRVIQMLRSESERLAIVNRERHDIERERDTLRWSRHLNVVQAKTLDKLMKQNQNEQLLSESRTRQQLISFWERTTTLSVDALWALLKNPNYARRLKQRHGTDLLNAWHDSRYATQLDRFFLMFLKYEVDGYPEKWSHLLIDEGQTLTPLDVMVLAKLSHGMTVFGDVLQSYHAHETTSWSSLLASEKQEWRIEYLTKAFRSTKPITSLAKQLLSRAGHDTSRIDPFDRAGKPVTFLRTSSSRDVKRQLESWRSSGLSICIIAPTMETAAFLDEKLPFPTQVVRSEDTKLGDGIIISTIDFLRGMEFDAVLLMYVDGTNYPTRPSMARKLYVSLTRALHEVVIHAKDDYSPLLGRVIETART